MREAMYLFTGVKSWPSQATELLVDGLDCFFSESPVASAVSRIICCWLVGLYVP